MSIYSEVLMQIAGLTTLGMLIVCIAGIIESEQIK